MAQVGIRLLRSRGSAALLCLSLSLLVGIPAAAADDTLLVVRASSSDASSVLIVPEQHDLPVSAAAIHRLLASIDRAKFGLGLESVSTRNEQALAWRDAQGRSLSHRIGEAQLRRYWSSIVAAHAGNLPPGLDFDGFDRLQPFWAITLYGGALMRAAEVNGPASRNRSASATSVLHAALRGQPLISLDTREDRANLLNHCDSDERIALFFEAYARDVEDSQFRQLRLNGMPDALRSGDPSRLERVLAESDTFGSERLIQECNVVPRSRRWVERIVATSLRRQDMIYVVGAAHVHGPEGLPALLKARGFKVAWEIH
jgi:hypothetical protein